MSKPNDLRSALEQTPGIKYIGHSYSVGAESIEITCPGPPYLRTNPDGSCAVCGKPATDTNKP